jgi:serine/threonine protein kinase
MRAADVPLQIYKIFQVLGFPQKSELPYLAGPYYDQLTGGIRGEDYTKFYSNLEKLFPTLSEIGLDLMSSLLKYDPEKRISVTDALNHPFFSASIPKEPVKLSNKTRRSEQEEPPVETKQQKVVKKPLMEESAAPYSETIGATTTLYRHSYRVVPQMDQQSASELLQESLDLIPLLNPHLASVSHVFEEEEKSQELTSRYMKLIILVFTFSVSRSPFEVTSTATTQTQTSEQFLEFTPEVNNSEEFQGSLNASTGSLLEALISIERFEIHSKLS